METLSWKKEIFGTKLEIYRKDNKIGSINWDSMLGSQAQAIINGRLFTLYREFFLSKLEIHDANSQALLASIMVNLFNPKSDIIINGKRFELEIQNFWQSRWSWIFNDEEIIIYTANDFFTKDKGKIKLASSMNEEVEILILLGLFVRNQFVLFMLLIIVVLILIFI